MKVILDANVWISYLLAASAEQTVRQLVRACVLELERIQLLVPPELIDELVEKVREKASLRERIPLDEVERLVAQLRLVAEIPPPLAEDLPSFASDPADDYLIVHGLAAEVRYLVTGDKRLRSLNQVAALRLVTPAEFLTILQAAVAARRISKSGMIWPRRRKNPLISANRSITGSLTP